MKINKLFSAFMLIAAISFASCKTPVVNPPEPPEVDTTTVTPSNKVEIPSSIQLPEGAITVSKAREICLGLQSGATSGTKYYVHGWVKKIHSKHADGVASFGNGQFYMSENKYTDGTYDKDDFTAYQVYGLNGQKLVSADQVEEGDYVVIYGELTNYNGTCETVGKGAAYIYASTNPKIGESTPPTPIEIDYQDGEMSVSDFLALDEIKSLGENKTTSAHYTVRGKVSATPKVPSVNLSYGSATFYLTDGVNTLYVYGVLGVDSVKLVNAAQVEVGDLVTVYAQCQNYKASTEGAEPILELKNGNITRTTNTFDPSQVSIPELTIAEALAEGGKLASGAYSDGQYKISGSVVEVKDFSPNNGEAANQTNGYGNATFYIGDDQGNRLQCFRMRYKEGNLWLQSDPALEVGDVVTVVGQLQNFKGTEVEVCNGNVTEHVK